MNLAIKEALKGTDNTFPNPRVGAVVVADGEVISKGKVVATSHADLRDSNRWSWQHYMTVIYQNRVFFCTHSKTDKSLMTPKKHWIGCDESQ